MKQMKVTIENYGPDVAVWPKGRKSAQLVSWLILHSARYDVLTGWQSRYTGKYGFQLMPYIVVSRYDSTLPEPWKKPLQKAGIRQFDAMLPLSILTILLGGVHWETAEAARDNAVKLPITYKGEFYVVGDGPDARHFLYRSQLDHVLAPQSILAPWDAILRRGWAWFYFGEA